jgi:hypothetical protein
MTADYIKENTLRQKGWVHVGLETELTINSNTDFLHYFEWVSFAEKIYIFNNLFQSRHILFLKCMGGILDLSSTQNLSRSLISFVYSYGLPSSIQTAGFQWGSILVTEMVHENV